MKKKILVTGASGFAAEHLIPKLRKAGHIVIGLDRKPNPSAECDNFICTDLSLKGEVSDDIPSIDVLIHMAAARADWGVSDEEFVRDNVKATKELLTGYLKTPPETLVFISSISVMPQDTKLVIDEGVKPAPINIYGLSKKDAEDLCIEFQKKTNTRLIIIRPSVLYGPSDPCKTGIYRAADNNIFRLIDGIYSNRFASVGSGDIIKSTAYVENFSDAIIFSLENSSQFELYIYADSPALSLNEIIENICSSLRKKIPPKLPFYFVYVLSKVFDFLSFITRINFPINSSRVETFIRPTNFKPKNFIDKGFEQKYSTEESLQRTVSWYLDLRKRGSGFFIFKDKS